MSGQSAEHDPILVPAVMEHVGHAAKQVLQQICCARLSAPEQLQQPKPGGTAQMQCTIIHLVVKPFTHCALVYMLQQPC